MSAPRGAAVACAAMRRHAPPCAAMRGHARPCAPMHHHPTPPAAMRADPSAMHVHPLPLAARQVLARCSGSVGPGPAGTPSMGLGVVHAHLFFPLSPGCQRRLPPPPPESPQLKRIHVGRPLRQGPPRQRGLVRGAPGTLGGGLDDGRGALPKAGAAGQHRGRPLTPAPVRAMLRTIHCGDCGAPCPAATGRAACLFVKHTCTLVRRAPRSARNDLDPDYPRPTGCTDGKVRPPLPAAGRAAAARPGAPRSGRAARFFTPCRLFRSSSGSPLPPSQAPPRPQTPPVLPRPAR